MHLLRSRRALLGLGALVALVIIATATFAVVNAAPEPTPTPSPSPTPAADPVADAIPDPVADASPTPSPTPAARGPLPDGRPTVDRPLARRERADHRADREQPDRPAAVRASTWPTW